MGSPRNGAVWTRLLWAAVLTLGALSVVWFSQSTTQQPPSSDPEQSNPSPAFPNPPFSETAFLNTGAEAHYIGSEACAKCHEKNHQSYLLTAHSRSLADIKLQEEPPDGTFTHPSGRTYRVYRQGNELRHEEVLRTAEGNEIARVNLPVRYLVGSGHFTRTYLVEQDGFLHESPITWYASKKSWDLSPGYRENILLGFERPVGADCLICHAGRAENVAGTLHRVDIPEHAIGCESCHGPGSLHQERYRPGKNRPSGRDSTIVDPKRLSRTLHESICASCHLSGPGFIPVRGREIREFRPGRPLTDYSVAYRFDGDNDQMTVVGHVEQLRASTCYQKSSTLTCTTCHDPHLTKLPENPVAFYREKCLTCHNTQSCNIDFAARRKKDPADNCMACHMSRGATDIPHIAFTHHRISRPKPAPESADIPELTPLYDDSQLPELDRKRNLGLAYVQAAGQHPKYKQVFEERARRLLEDVRQAGLVDTTTTAVLAHIYLTRDRFASIDFAREILETKDAPLGPRSIALGMMARTALEERDYSSAVKLLQEVVSIRRQAQDWQLLGVAYSGLNQFDRALDAFQKSLEIQPAHHGGHQGIAEVYERIGDMKRAAEHKQKAQWLVEHPPNNDDRRPH